MASTTSTRRVRNPETGRLMSVAQSQAHRKALNAAKRKRSLSTATATKATKASTPASTFVAGKRVPEIVAAVIAGTAPTGTLEALMERFEGRAERRALKLDAMPAGE